MIELDIIVDGREHHVTMEEQDGQWVATVDGRTFPVYAHRRRTQAAVTAGGHAHVVDLLDAHTAEVDGRPVPFQLLALKGVEGAQTLGAGTHGPVKPPMTGRIEAVHVTAGDTVSRGDVLFVLEAMKMRNEIKAPADGTVTAVHSKAGDTVDSGTIVLELAP